MPNHTTNILIVQSKSKEKLQAVKDFLANDKQAIDFNKVLPCPEVLHQVSSPVHVVSQKELDKEVQRRNKLPADSPERSFNMGFPITAEMQTQYRRLYGFDNWYDWCCSNWGTKWNAYDIGDWNGNKISFYTAWSPPEPVIVKLSQAFPDITFKLRYADEGGSYVGDAAFKNGKVDDDTLGSDDPNFKEIYYDITGIDLDENEE